MKIGIPMSPSKTQYFINQAYIEYVIKADLEPVLIVPGMPIETIIQDIDGLLLPGGIDIDPIYYGEDNDTSYGIDPVKDEFERGLFHIAISNNIPVFGICRGTQLIVREYLLYTPHMSKYIHFTQHLSHHNQTDEQQLSRNTCQHHVQCLHSKLYNLLEQNNTESRIAVNSMHHQGIIVNFRQAGVVGMDGFNMLAWTRRGVNRDPKNKDDHRVVCEAFEINSFGVGGVGLRILAVQWHPEELCDTTLIHRFFNKNEGVVQAATQIAVAER